MPNLIKLIRCLSAFALAVAIFAGLTQNASAQGCVAARCPANLSPATMSLHGLLGEAAPPTSGWQATVAYRWFKSDRHFTGTHEDKERQEEHTEVINDSSYYDFNLTYAFNPRLSANLTLPFSDHDRSSAVRNTAREVVGRSHVQAGGLGDIRLGLSYWLWDPAGTPAAPEPTGKGKAPVAPAHSTGRRGNILVGIGIDMPTGEDDAGDHRSVYDPATGGLRKDPNEVIVDQSIQPGDGGWGIPIDLYAYYTFTDKLTGYLSASYNITPEEDNGVLTGRGNINDPTNNFESIMSIADTFAARMGLEYALLPKQGVSVSIGLRTEGVPVYDLLGGSEDFRRPGIVIAWEPGISWMYKGWSASLTVPVAFYRERFQSVPDKQRTAATGIYRHGDAAFADYAVMFAVGKTF